MRRAGSYLSYAFTVTLSAFLLFAVQPIAGKYLLPYFGGSSSVWATSLFFFTTALFFGYLYVFLLTRLRREAQLYIHAAVLAAAALYAFGALMLHGAFPPLAWTVGASGAPAAHVLSALLLAIGAPYIVLATTGPLLQYWYGMTSRREPYALYALSNAGSLFALAAYPFLIEPHLLLRSQEQLWTLLFLVYAICTAAIAVSLRHTPFSRAHEGDVGTERPRESRTAALMWTAYAALPAFFLVAATTQITQVIAPVPLLWVIPLALYLVTFILAFSGRGGSVFLPLLLFAASAAAYRFAGAENADAFWQVLSYLALLFFIGLFCHGRLYARRPATERLPAFYLYVSFGGMLGTFAASVLAPLVFPDFWEFPVGIAIAAILAVCAFPPSYFPRAFGTTGIRLTRAAFAAAAVYLLFGVVTKFIDDPVLISRNFYGTVNIAFLDTMTMLSHGTTIHGIQFNDRARAYTPTSYYIPTSGIGRAFAYKRARADGPLSAGVVGLGTGSLAAYCADGDTFVFYEIDPRIETIARTYFSYLTHCTGSSVRLGDARMILEEERRAGARGAYDIIAIDAFTDDTIPAHLLTIEAFRLYTDELRGRDGIIAVHVSNRYLDLAPVVLRIAAELGMNGMTVRDNTESNVGMGSIWVLLTEDAGVLRAREFAQKDPLRPDANAPLWTDEYTSLLPILDLPLRRSRGE